MTIPADDFIRRNCSILYYLLQTCLPSKPIGFYLLPPLWLPPMLPPLRLPPEELRLEEPPMLPLLREGEELLTLLLLRDGAEEELLMLLLREGEELLTLRLLS